MASVKFTTLRFTDDRRYALVLAEWDNGESNIRVHTVHDGEVTANGRWECSERHLEHFASVYNDRFPIQATTKGSGDV